MVCQLFSENNKFLMLYPLVLKVDRAVLKREERWSDFMTYGSCSHYMMITDLLQHKVSEAKG